MHMNVKVRLTRKVGQSNYGSLGASCDVQLEQDGTLLFADPHGLQDKIRSAYAECERAIAAELDRQTSSEETSTRHGPASNGDGSTNGHRRMNDSCQSGADSSPRKATPGQIQALHAIANRQGLDLTDVLQDRLGLYSVEFLSVAEASQLIHEMNETPTSPPDERIGGG